MTEDEMADLVEKRMVRLLDRDTGVRLPPGMRLAWFTAHEYELTVDAWTVPWLGEPKDRKVSACGWTSQWTEGLRSLFADPVVPDRDVARYAVMEIAAGAAAAVMHEVVEWAQLDGRPLWDAHGNSAAASIADNHGKAVFSDAVAACLPPVEID